MKLICQISHIDWQGNPGTTIARGETFEIDDSDRIKTWIDAGYVSLVEDDDVGAEEAPAPISDEVQEVKRPDGTELEKLKDIVTDTPVKTRRGRKKS